ncbi:MAG: OmpA family protein [Marinagarivorans sp.]|nr:OmpA family protein [Marinagarivorans sp.]
MRILTVALLAASMTACTTMDPYSGDKKVGKATTGATLGAIGGAVLGAATAGKGNKDRAILTGAVAGAALGGGVGYYMDRQEKVLRDRLVGSGVQVQRDGDKLRLIMPGNITFETAKSDIRGDFYSVLDSVVLVLKEFKDNSILVTGHTDSVGNDASNQALSERRAFSVKNYLASAGVPSGRVQAIGYGERYPVASNDSEQGRGQNRRVELELEALR